MFKKKKKQVHFSSEFPLNGGGDGGFILRLTETRADIETKSKDWKVVFAQGTYEYAFMVHLAQKNSFSEIYQCAVAIYSTRVVFRDPKACTDIYKLLDKSGKRLLAAAKAKQETQSDEEILAEEKVLHEQTPEAVAELEEIRNKNKNKNEQEGTN